MNKHKIQGRLSDDIYKMINTDSQASMDVSPSMSVISTVIISQSSPIKKNDQEKTKNWPTSISIPEEYANYREEFTGPLEPFANMWDGHLGRIYTFKQHTYLESPNIRPVKLISYCAGWKDRDFEQLETDNELVMNVIDPAERDWAPTAEFAPKKDESLRFCVEYRKLNGVTVCDLNPLSRMNK